MYATRLFVSVIAFALLANLAQADTISGPGYTALVLDGTNYVTIPSDVSVEVGKSFSFEAWIFAPQVTSQMAIVSRINTSTVAPADSANDFFLQVNAQGHVILALGGFSLNGASEFGFLIASEQAIVANTWYHVAFTIEYINLDNDAPYRANLYVDKYNSGSLSRDTQSVYWYGPGYTRVTLTNEVITVGKYINSGNPSGIFFSGSVDEVRIWQGARTGSEIKSYCVVSIDRWQDNHWALTSDQAGSSSNLLVASYNFNQEDITVTVADRSQHGYDATVHFTSASASVVFAANPVQFVQYARVNGEVPVAIPLYGLDVATVSDADVQFVVYWTDSEVQGELFNYDAQNTGEPVKTDPLFLAENKEQALLGKILGNGSEVDTSQDTVVVYVTLPDFTGNNARFRYYAIQNGVVSASTEVRLWVDCAGNRSAIDMCGVCHGDNSTCRNCAFIDRCGVCNGTNDCVGCDNVTNSGKEYDRCGVCGGLNLCLGCDHMGGGIPDNCGVCNGDNSTCPGGCVLDACGVCNGNGTECTCVRYHGYHVQELDYLLFKWGLDNALANIEQIITQLSQSLQLLEGYDGDVDLAAMTAYLNEFTFDYATPYDDQVSRFIAELKKAVGDSLTK